MPRHPVPTSLPIALENGHVYLQSVVQDPPSLGTSSSCRGLAIIAHPFGRLGGSLDDPIVTHLASLLLTHAYVRVVRFNSRGVGKSGGSASWTGRSECSDFQEIVSKCVDNFCLDFPHTTAAQLIIAGYSAGSLYASTVRVPPAIYDLRQFRGGNRPRYILLSFPAGVTWALSFFTTKSYTNAFNKLLASTTTPGGNNRTVLDEREVKAASRVAESTPSNDGAAQPVSSHIITIYGDQDQFTGLATYQTWTNECSSIAASPIRAELEAEGTQDRQKAQIGGSTFHHVVIQGADHFYRSNQALDGLDKAVVEWLDALTD
ncbi:uncharacterized protein MEPE_00097 [Melanopsichium pennsylvanicum]|uniref:Serine aminopeptidase S33 domain-containing protein n=2 Tax=Melanopsichium pennsylvanicum TaxID=63383 RepID=A0AAJ5C2E0_9BASI|nr:conserved hypothetical protein [Melanopsichium pennsylvanicum 4]SNX81392.1 uncharacterized protein MEPE_00097 [Melanopsichium pennsylvanicum]